MLSNAYFLAKFRFDTAENEPAKNLQNFRKMHFSKNAFFGNAAGAQAPLAAAHARRRGPPLEPTNLHLRGSYVTKSVREELETSHDVTHFSRIHMMFPIRGDRFFRGEDKHSHENRTDERKQQE